jgi:hypothetical protein
MAVHRCQKGRLPGLRRNCGVGIKALINEIRIYHRADKSKNSDGYCNSGHSHPPVVNRLFTPISPLTASRMNCTVQMVEMESL